MTLDSQLLINLLLAILVSAAASFIMTPLVKTFAQKVGAMDVPKDDRRMHNVPIPRLGGLAVFIAFILSVLLFVDIDTQLQGILLGAVVIVITGVLDDIISLNAWVKLLCQIGAACVAVFHGCVIQVFSNPNIFSPEPYLDLGVLAIPITIIWIVAITNSVNLIDGLDGLSAGVSCISSATMLVIALMVAESNVALIMAALVGACLGFIPYNFNPAKIFIGDTGAMFLGYILATISVQGFFKFYAIISFAVPFLILGVPIFDTVFAFFRRLLSGKNPMKADRGHVHHRLIDMGFNQKQSVAILYLITAILGLSAVVLTASGEIKAMILIASVLVVAAIAFRGVFKHDAAKTAKNEETAPPANLDELAADGQPEPDVMPSEDAPEQTGEGENSKENNDEED